MSVSDDDTGPQYPPGPLAGSNGIGKLAIGIAQIGDIQPFNWEATILSQYANSPTLTQLIANISAYVDPTQNIEQFSDLIMHLDTAQYYGLDVWGRIVGVQRTLEVQNNYWFGFAEALPGSQSFNDAGTKEYLPAFGFAEAMAPAFNEAPFGLTYYWAPSAHPNIGAFYSGQTLTNNYQLTDESYRLLILAKAAANITNGSVPAINQILLSLFPNRGNCYVTDGPKYGTYFGFAEAINSQPFNQAPFYDGESYNTKTMTYTFTFQLSPVELAIVEQSGVLPKPVGVAASVVIL
jgi:hypothetical protein